MKAAKASADNQLQLQTQEAGDLDDDLTKWRTDAESAERVAARFETRVTDAGTELAAVETAIVELGRELAGASALLVGAIDERAPAPVRPPPAAP
jgi:chromosome segregation ATPase